MDIIHSQRLRAKFCVQATEQTSSPSCDSLSVVKRRNRFVRIDDIQTRRNRVRHNLALQGSRSAFFVTRDSRRYALVSESLDEVRGRVDSLHARTVQHMSIQERMIAQGQESFVRLHDVFAFHKMRQWDVSPLRIWQMSMMSAVVFGMVTMSLIYKNLGQSVFAFAPDAAQTYTMDPVTALLIEGGTSAITEEVSSYIAPSPIVQSEPGRLPLEDDYGNKTADDLAFEKRATALVSGYPIEKMLPYIFKLDRDVAIYMIALAKQESAWGKRRPVLAGQDCYNYWGYRAKRARMGSGGHTCFDSRQDAVKTVAKRIHSLIYEYHRTTPRELLVWKCGYSCAGHSSEGVERWVSTITAYRNKLIYSKEE